MMGSEELIEEDWERVSLTDSIYLYEEEQRKIEEEYQYWLSLQEGKVIIEDEKQEKIIINSSLLPF